MFELGMLPRAARAVRKRSGPAGLKQEVRSLRMQHGKLVKRLQLPCSRAVLMYDGLAVAWNAVHGLREGERAATLQKGPVRADGRRHRKHRNRWDFVATMTVAFKDIGHARHAGQPGELGHTRRAVECLAAHSALARRVQSDMMGDTLGRSDFVVMDMASDATPRLVSFGDLAADVMGHARFLHRTHDRWQLLDLAAFRELHPRVRPTFGVVEIFVQLYRVRWTEGLGDRHSELFFVPPCVVASTKASCLWEAQQALAPELAKAKINEMCASGRIVIMHETVDSCASNLRMAAFRAVSLPKSALYCRMLCSAHIVHLILTKGPNIISEHSLIGDVYAFAFVGNVASHHLALLYNLRALISEKLIVIDDGRAPFPQEQIRAILEFTVGSNLKQSRGRNPDALGVSDDVTAGSGCKAVADICDGISFVFNADPRTPYPAHIVTDATRHFTRDQLVNMMADAFLRAGFLSGTSAQLPSKNRWGSMFDTLQGQVGGFLLHNLGGQCALLTFRTWAAGAPLVAAGDDDEDYKTMVMKKGWRVRCYVSDTDRRRRACLTLFVSLPLDHLWRRLQYIEEQG